MFPTTSESIMPSTSAVPLRLPLLLLLTLGFLVLGCSDDDISGTDDEGADPSATITAPDDGSAFVEADDVTFSGTATDPEDGEVTGAALAWSSDQDGEIGTGSSITVATLSTGDHTITLTATDSDGGTGSASIGITITANQAASVTIDQPADGSTFAEGETVDFEGSATDPEDGDLTGDALVWSSDLDGELGTGASVSTSALSEGTHVISLEATDSHGETATADINIQVEAAGLWAQLSAGVQHTCGVTDGGDGYCWGNGDNGVLGTGSQTNQHTPAAASGGHAWVAIDAGPPGGSVPRHANTCGLTESGEVWCWGDGWDGQLGNGTLGTEDCGDLPHYDVECSTVPVQVSGGHSWTAVDVGGDHACGITIGEEIYCWGEGEFGQLGNGDTADQSEPVLVTGGHAWAAVSAGRAHTCALTTAGDAYCWGSGQFGELGTGTAHSSYQENAPAPVAGGHAWNAISAGFGVSCGVTTDGAGMCWGYNGDGMLGTGTAGSDDCTSSGSDCELEPAAVAGGHSWNDIDAAGGHVCGLTTDGAAYCWGFGRYGRLGNDAEDDHDTPVAVAGGGAWAAIDTGGYHTCALGPAGNAYCWGNGTHGQLGNGSTDDSLVPTPVSDPE